LYRQTSINDPCQSFLKTRPGPFLLTLIALAVNSALVLAAAAQEITPIKTSIGTLKVQKMAGPFRKKSISHEEEIDLVDYQLNLDFSPTKISNLFAKKGGKVELIVYSYFRYPIISKIFGGSRNFFSIVVTKHE